MNALIRIRSRIFIILVLSFIALTLLTISNLLDEIDENIVRSIDRGNAAMDTIMIIFSAAADITPFYFSPLLIIAFVLTIKRTTRKVGAILLITIVIVAFLSLQLKELINRDRPNYEFKPNVSFEYKIERTSDSYPSGHAARSAAFTYIISYLLKRKPSILMWIFPIGVGVSRVYMGLHYPTDVIAGILLGLIIASIFASLLKIDKPLIKQ